MAQYLIVDDHYLFVGALEREISQLAPEASFHRASSLASALMLLRRHGMYEIVFLDLKLPDSAGLEAVRAMVEALPNLKVVVVSAYDDPRLMREAYESGAVGFISKSLEPIRFQRALESLFSGGYYFSAEALAAKPISESLAGLTPRERQVLDQLVSGQSTKLIARKLGLAPTTVDKHLDQIRSKVGAPTRMQLLAKVRELLEYR